MGRFDAPTGELRVDRGERYLAEDDDEVEDDEEGLVVFGELERERGNERGEKKEGGLVGEERVEARWVGSLQWELKKQTIKNARLSSATASIWRRAERACDASSTRRLAGQSEGPRASLSALGTQERQDR